MEQSPAGCQVITERRSLQAEIEKVMSREQSIGHIVKKLDLEKKITPKMYDKDTNMR
jgi:hypothetical protein